MKNARQLTATLVLTFGLFLGTWAEHNTALSTYANSSTLHSNWLAKIHTTQIHPNGADQNSRFCPIGNC